MSLEPKARPTRSVSALARAKRRRRSAGAALFIVAVTLGLLAAMGVYGLSATAYDVRAAGQGRQAAQTQHSAEMAIMMASTVITPGNAQVVLNRMRADRAVRTSTCTTAAAQGAATGDEARNRSAEACLTLTPETMAPLTTDPSAWTNNTNFAHTFGPVAAVKPFTRIEFTNPVDYEAPAGYSTSSAGGVRPPVFTSIRATVFVQMHRMTSATPPAPDGPALATATGRGRLIVGPYMP